MIKLLICFCCLTALPIRNVFPQEIGPEVLVPLQAMLGSYWKGQVSNEAFTRYVDHAVAKEPDVKAKAKILQVTVDQINTAVVPKHDVDALIIRYSSELADISDRPDVVSEAHVMSAVANENKAEASSGKSKRPHFLSALKSWITISKIISENLKQPERVESPSVRGYMQDKSNSQYLTLLKEHETDQAKRDFIDEQNNLIRLVLPAKDGMERVQQELHLTDEEFSKIWMDVETRKFDRGG